MDPLTGGTEKSSGRICAIDKDKTRDVEEEKRILYVALTRAREWLIISSSVKKGDAKDKPPYWSLEKSSWLCGIDSAFQLDGGNLVGDPSETDEIELCMNVGEPCHDSSCDGPLPVSERMSKLLIRRIIHMQTNMEQPRLAAREPSKELTEKLRAKLDSMPAPEQPSSRRYIITASEISAFEKCPRMYAYRAVWGASASKIKMHLHEEPLPDEPDLETPETESFEMPASVWGSLAHRVMEQVSFDASDDQVRELVSSVFSREGYTDKSFTKNFSPDRLTDLIIQTLHLPLITRLQKCAPENVNREFRLIGRIDDLDEVVMGILDVLAVCDNKLIVIDYKSGNVANVDPTARAADYSTQLALYSILAADRFGKSVDEVEAHIVFLDPPKDVPVPFDKSGADTVRNLSTRSEIGDFTADPSPKKCAWCDYRDICRYVRMPG